MAGIIKRMLRKAIRKNQDNGWRKPRHIKPISGEKGVVKKIEGTRYSIEKNPEARGFALHKDLEMGGSFYIGNLTLFRTGGFRRKEEKK